MAPLPLETASIAGQILNAIPLPILLREKDGGPVFANLAIQRLAGSCEGDATGIDPQMLQRLGAALLGQTDPDRVEEAPAPYGSAKRPEVHLEHTPVELAGAPYLLSVGSAMREEDVSYSPAADGGIEPDRSLRVLRELEEAAAVTTGNRLFAELARHFTRATGADSAFVYEVATRDPLTVRLRGAYEHGAWTIDNNATPTDGYPSNRLYNGLSRYVVKTGLRNEYPQFDRPAPRNWDSYAGVGIAGRDGSLLGHFSMLSRRPLENEGHLLSVLALFAARAATELQRERDERRFAAKQEELVQAQKMEAVGRLAGGIAHDFNNLLMSVMGTAELLLIEERWGSEAAVRGELEKIRAISESGAQLTKQLLAFSRRQLTQPRPINLRDVVLRMEKVLRTLVGESIIVELQLGKRIGRVLADEGQIQQVIMNLAVNARDAMPSGGRLRITTDVLNPATETDRLGLPDPDVAYVRLNVEDTGHGMSAEVQARIFEPFFSTKARESGSGIGLSTVYGIVQQHHGVIRVRSLEQVGTTFSVLIPEIEDTANPAIASEAQPTNLKGHATILLTEDDDSVRRPLLEILKLYGYNVLEARSSGESLLIGERHPDPIHLLLTDVMMPHMNGRELAERIVGIRPEIRVIFMSGYTADVLGRGQVLGAEHTFLQKPFAPAVLLQTIQQILAPYK